ncbi:MAG: hypothetical protein LBR56_00495, partial [Sporomusaceae bacterium]|nr:hypothetical protein [Sporomusaceae bacterium]
PAEEARRGAAKLWEGDLSGAFWGAVVIAGTLVPLMLNLFFPTALWQMAAAILALVGGIYLRIGFLKAAVRVLLPGEEKSEMSGREIAQLAAALEKRWQEKAAWLNPRE